MAMAHFRRSPLADTDFRLCAVSIHCWANSVDLSRSNSSVNMRRDPRRESAKSWCSCCRSERRALPCRSPGPDRGSERCRTTAASAPFRPPRGSRSCSCTAGRPSRAPGCESSRRAVVGRVGVDGRADRTDAGDVVVVARARRTEAVLDRLAGVAGCVAKPWIVLLKPSRRVGSAWATQTRRRTRLAMLRSTTTERPTRTEQPTQTEQPIPTERRGPPPNQLVRHWVVGAGVTSGVGVGTGVGVGAKLRRGRRQGLRRTGRHERVANVLIALSRECALRTRFEKKSR